MNLMDTPIQLWFLFSGEDQHHYRQNISHRKSRQGPTVPWFWHGSNSTLLSPETKVSPNPNPLYTPVYSVRIRAIGLTGAVRRWNHDRRKAVFQGQLAELRQFMALQFIPAEIGR